MSISLPGGSTRLATGTAHVDVTGAVTRGLDLNLTLGVIVPDETSVLTFRSGTADSLVIEAVAKPGTIRTSLAKAVGGTSAVTTALTIGLTGPAPDVYVSHSGECSLTFTVAGPSGVRGTFRCSNVQGGSGSIDSSGTFAANP